MTERNIRLKTQRLGELDAEPSRPMAYVPIGKGVLLKLYRDCFFFLRLSPPLYFATGDIGTTYV